MENDGAAGGEELASHLSAAELAGFTALPEGRSGSVGDAAVFSEGLDEGREVIFRVFVMLV